MDVRKIVSDIDAEIAKLQGVRATLLGLQGSSTVTAAPKGRRGRPKGSKNAPKTAVVAKKKTRKLSPEGRKRIADAMKKRWAERRKETGK
jgi:hypothetical protein